MSNVSAQVTAKVIAPNKCIVIEWDGYSGRTTVEWKFAVHTNSATFVSIAESGWTGSGDELVKYATDSTEGFTWTLAGLKALLEHNLRLNAVADRFSQGARRTLSRRVSMRRTSPPDYCRTLGRIPYNTRTGAQHDSHDL